MAASEVELTDDEVARLEDVFEPGGTAGERYPEGSMQTVDL